MTHPRIYIICLQLSNVHIWSCIERIKAYFSIQTIIDLHHEYACHLASGINRAQHLSVACSLYTCIYILLIQQCRRHTLYNKCRSNEYRCKWFVLLKFVVGIFYQSRNRSTNKKIDRRLISKYCFSI